MAPLLKLGFSSIMSFLSTSGIAFNDFNHLSCIIYVKLVLTSVFRSEESVILKLSFLMVPPEGLPDLVELSVAVSFYWFSEF